MAKIVCVDPVTGYPRTYARDGIPDIDRYPGGQTTPMPKVDRFHARRIWLPSAWRPSLHARGRGRPVDPRASLDPLHA